MKKILTYLMILIGALILFSCDKPAPTQLVDDTNNEDDGNFLLLCICVGGFNNTGEFCRNRNPSDEQLVQRRMPISSGRAMVGIVHQ